MIDNRLLPVNIIRLFTWDALRNNTPINESDYGGDIPIIPISDEPKYAAIGKPYFIYGYTEQGGREEVKEGVVAFRVVGQSYAQINHYTNVIQRTFEDYFVVDQINRWSSNYQAVDMVGIRFGSLEVTYVEGGDPPESEAGRRDSVINITYTYVADYPIKTYQKDSTTGDWIWR